MQFSILEALYDGKIIPWERQRSQSPERLALEMKIENEIKYFTERMSSADCQRFEKLEGLYYEAVLEETVGIYSHGFTFGALLMMKVMVKGGELTMKS